MKYTMLALTGALALAACGPTAPNAGGDAAEASPENAKLTEALAADLRADDKARDAFRNPAETLAFFQVKPDQTVIEYAPGGGWYTRILAPI